MCHGHPRYHPCKHTSVKWLYCPDATFDLTNGNKSPCSRPIWTSAEETTKDCPYSTCNFASLRGPWQCCKCGQGPNEDGWCAMPRRTRAFNPVTHLIEEMGSQCSHGCCTNCTRYYDTHAPPQASSPESSHIELRSGGRSGRKSHHHRRTSPHDYDGDISTFEQVATTSSSAAAARSSHRSSHDKDSDHTSKKTKTKGSKHRRHH